MRTFFEIDSPNLILRLTELTNSFLEKEIERMQRENLELKLENEILKNADVV